MSSIPLCDAASISIKSIKLPSSIEMQFAHLPQGSGDTPSRQLSALANKRAIVVFPTPLVPEKRSA